MRILFTSGELVTGPATQGPEPVDEQPVGTYYFKCTRTRTR